MGGCAIAHNGNLTNAESLRKELIERGSIFQSSSDSECIIHLMARSIHKDHTNRLKDALSRVEGAFSVVAMTRTKLIGVRDPRGVRPLVLGKLGEGWVLSSETCALDIVGAEHIREIEPGEMIVIGPDGIKSTFPFERTAPRPCIFEKVYFFIAYDTLVGPLADRLGQAGLESHPSAWDRSATREQSLARTAAGEWRYTNL